MEKKGPKEQTNNTTHKIKDKTPPQPTVKVIQHMKAVI